MDRNCNKCINHTSGSCSAWECTGTVTVDDVRKNAIEEHFKKIMSFIDTDNRGNCDYFIVDQIENYIAEQLKEKKNLTCFDCEHHFMSDCYLECNKHNRINDNKICDDFEQLKEHK